MRLVSLSRFVEWRLTGPKLFTRELEPDFNHAGTSIT